MADIHVTVAAVIKSDDKFLIVEEKNSANETVYNQPAGHVEHNESVIDAVVREVAEETGLEFLPRYLIGTYYLSPASNGKHYLRFCFYGEVDPQQRLSPQDPDIIAAHWMTLEDICHLGTALRSGLVLQCLSDFNNGQEFPIEQLKHSNNEPALAQLCYHSLLQK